MAAYDVLIMVITRMRAGICTAGFINQPHPASRLRWVRPVKRFEHVLLGDLTDAADGQLLRCCDVVRLNLMEPCPDPPHTEDWLCDFVHKRPRRLRRLEGEHRATFLRDHVDQAPEEVLDAQPSRSLCLIRPDQWWASFQLDSYSLKYEARIGFTLEGVRYPRTNPSSGLPVTDIRWRALGRCWSRSRSGRLTLNQDALLERLAAQEAFLSVGLGRPYQGKIWPLVIGVHLVPDYQIQIDYEEL
jgi:hypothetical protein